MTLPSTAITPLSEAPLGLEVTVGLMDGSSVHGRLAEFEPARADFLLTETSGRAQQFAARRVAYIGFHPSPHDAIDLFPAGAEEYKVHAAGGLVFEVVLVPGSWRNSSGFFATPRRSSPFRELFFFNHGVRAREKDEPIGTMLIKQGALHPDALDHAVLAQSSERATPIGQILVETLKVSERDVARAVALQQERKQRIGEVLTQEGLATREDVEAAFAEQQRRKGKRLGEVLVDMHVVTEQTLVKTLAKKFDLRYVNCSDYPPPSPELANELPLNVAEKYGVLPIELRNDTLVIAISDPLAFNSLDLAALHPERHIELVMTTPTALRERLDLLRGGDAPTPASADGAELENLLKLLAEEHPQARAESGPPARQATAAELLENLVLEANRRKAPHIHLEIDAPERGAVRFRSEAGCHVVDALPQSRIAELVAHIGNEARLDPLERDVPQHGTITVNARQTSYELSVSLIPLGPSGADVVLSFTSAARARLSLVELGFTSGTLRAFQRMLDEPSGLVLFVGPLGSGRTTSMHAALGALDASRLKIWAAEDEPPFIDGSKTIPGGVRQLQVKPHVGFSFASALRCLLKADADVILIGELDDPETARIALDGVHAGRRVLSAVNAHWAIEGLARLLDMPLDSHAIGSSLRGILAQRLVRRLCSECRQSAPATLSERDELARACRNVQIESLMNWIFEPDLTFWHARGCSACDGSGYTGKMALQELLVVDRELAQAIANRAPTSELRRIAGRSGMTTLLQDGIAKALAGLTDLRQVLSALQSQ